MYDTPLAATLTNAVVRKDSLVEMIQINFENCCEEAEMHHTECCITRREYWRQDDAQDLALSFNHTKLCVQKTLLIGTKWQAAAEDKPGGQHRRTESKTLRKQLTRNKDWAKFLRAFLNALIALHHEVLILNVFTARCHYRLEVAPITLSAGASSQSMHAHIHKTNPASKASWKLLRDSARSFHRSDTSSIR